MYMAGTCNAKQLSAGGKCKGLNYLEMCKLLDLSTYLNVGQYRHLTGTKYESHSGHSVC